MNLGMLTLMQPATAAAVKLDLDFMGANLGTACSTETMLRLRHDCKHELRPTEFADSVDTFERVRNGLKCTT